MQVLVGQMKNHEPLSRDVEHMNPNEVVEHPSCGRMLETLAFLVRKCGLMLLEGCANPIPRAAYTSKQTVITISSAMMRLGFLR